MGCVGPDPCLLLWDYATQFWRLFYLPVRAPFGSVRCGPSPLSSLMGLCYLFYEVFFTCQLKHPLDQLDVSYWSFPFVGLCYPIMKVVYLPIKILFGSVGCVVVVLPPLSTLMGLYYPIMKVVYLPIKTPLVSWMCPYCQLEHPLGQLRGCVLLVLPLYLLLWDYVTLLWRLFYLPVRALFGSVGWVLTIIGSSA